MSAPTGSPDLPASDAGDARLDARSEPRGGAGRPPRPGWPTGWAPRIVVGAVVGGFLLRVAWAWWATRPPVGMNDPSTYLGLAERFADGLGYVDPSGEPTAYFPPGYPMALGAAIRVVRAVGLGWSTPTVAAALNVVLGTATVALLALLARRVLGWKVAAVVAVLVACFPTLIAYSSLILSETLFLFLVAASLTVALWRPLADGVGVGRAAAAGLLLGGALLVRPVGGLLVVALVAGLALALPRRQALVGSAVLIVAVLVVLGPWVVRNAVALDAGPVLSTNTGDNLCIGNNPEASGSFQLPDHCFADLPGQGVATAEAEVARAAETQSRAIDWILAHPLEQPRLVVLRTIATFQHGHDPRWASQSYGNDIWFDDRTSVRLDVVGDVGWFSILALGLCGAPALWGRRDPRRAVLLGSVVGLAVSTWPFFGDPRFGLPAVVLLTLPAGVVIAGLPVLWDRWRATGAPPPT